MRSGAPRVQTTRPPGPPGHRSRLPAPPPPLPPPLPPQNTRDWPSSATSEEEEDSDDDHRRGSDGSHGSGGFGLLGVTVRRTFSPRRVDTAARAFDRDGDGTLDDEELHAFFYAQWLALEARRRAAGPRRRCLIGVLRGSATVVLAALMFVAIVALATVPRLNDFDRFDREEISITRPAAANSNVDTTHLRHPFQVSHDGGDPSKTWTDVIERAATGWANSIVLTAHPQHPHPQNTSLTLRPARVFHFNFPAMRRFPPWFLRALTLDTLDFTVLEIALMLDITIHEEHLPHLATFLLRESGPRGGGGSMLFSRESGTWWSVGCQSLLAGAPAQFRVTQTHGINCTMSQQPDPPIHPRTPFIFVFAVLNVCISVGATLWLLQLARHVGLRLWSDAVAGIGREFFDQSFRRRADSASVLPVDPVDVSTPPPPDPDVLDVVDVNPMFLLDCLVAQSPVDCELSYRPACLSVFVHLGMVGVPVLPIVLFVALVGCGHVDRDPWKLEEAVNNDGVLWCEPGWLQTAGLAVVFGQCLVWSVYSVSWHASAPAGVQRCLLHVSLFTWLVATGLSTLFTVNVFLWLCLVLLVHPVTAMALLVLLGAGPFYVYFAVSQFLALQKALKNNMKSVNATRAQALKAARAAGLDNAYVVSLIVAGSLIILATVSWLILGYLMLVAGSRGGGLEGQVGQLAAAGSAALAGLGKLRQQIGEAKARLKRSVAAVVDGSAAKGIRIAASATQSGAKRAISGLNKMEAYGDTSGVGRKRE